LAAIFETAMIIKPNLPGLVINPDIGRGDVGIIAVGAGLDISTRFRMQLRLVRGAAGKHAMFQLERARGNGPPGPGEMIAERQPDRPTLVMRKVKQVLARRVIQPFRGPD
jgi:hypothetical protein